MVKKSVFLVEKFLVSFILLPNLEYLRGSWFPAMEHPYAPAADNTRNIDRSHRCTELLEP